MNFDRRIGRRVSAIGMRFAWITRLGWRGRRPKNPPTARVIDLSLTGAGVVAPASDLGPGAHVEIAMDGARGVVVIRHIEQLDDPAVAKYGVEFVELEPALRQTIVDAVSTDRHQWDWTWEVAN